MILDRSCAWSGGRCAESISDPVGTGQFVVSCHRRRGVDITRPPGLALEREAMPMTCASVRIEESLPVPSSRIYTSKGADKVPPSKSELAPACRDRVGATAAAAPSAFPRRRCTWRDPTDPPVCREPQSCSRAGVKSCSAQAGLSCWQCAHARQAQRPSARSHGTTMERSGATGWAGLPNMSGWRR
jgi:hypothetical protein